MKISHNWLKQYVPHELTPLELSDLLTMSGLEVDSIETFGSSLEGVVVGHVLTTRRHPNADRLTLCDVELGDGVPVQIVCGAPNVEPGQKVPVATIGTTLLLPSRKNPSVREPVTLQKAQLRGEVSEGMICAEDELGLSEDHSGIMVLDEDAVVGRSFEAYLQEQGREVQDKVLDVSITPNRPDAISHIGIARDVSALTGMMLKKPSVSLPDAGDRAAELARVQIEAPEACPRYVAILVQGVTVKESPDWLKRRLIAVGLRPRNNIVDVTNYVMYECGQPLHAFDFDQIAGSTIIVRLSKDGEPFTTLDSKKWTLPQDTLLICDADRPVAIAGVMGGENSEVTYDTVNVLIESAFFDPSHIRRAVKLLGLQTDASYRFERGVDPEGQLWAATRAADLIAELGGGEVIPGAVDAHPNPLPKRQSHLRLSRIKKVLGVEIPTEEIFLNLKAIGFEIQEENPLEVLAEQALEGRSLQVEETEINLLCTIPSFRPDIEREIDIIEEVARLYGYHRIPEPKRSMVPNTPVSVNPVEELRNKTRVLLQGLGYREIYTNSMLRKETAEQFNDSVLSSTDEVGSVVETLNPISQEMAALRPSLLPGMLQVMSFNQNHGQRILRFFEFGHIFKRSESQGTYVPGYLEHESFIIGISGLFTPSGWDINERDSDFFDLKGVVEVLLQDLRIADVEVRPVYHQTGVTSYHVEVRNGKQRLGIIARVSDAITQQFDLKTPVFFAGFDWGLITALAAPAMRKRYAPVSRFPVVERDLAIVVDENQPVGPILNLIRESAAPLLRKVSIFDLYSGDRVAPDKKSIAFALRFSADKTLQDEEVDRMVSRIVNNLREHFNAELRQ